MRLEGEGVREAGMPNPLAHPRVHLTLLLSQRQAATVNREECTVQQELASSLMTYLGYGNRCKCEGRYLDEAVLEQQLNDLLEKGQQAGMVDADAPLQKGQRPSDLRQFAVVWPQAVHSCIEHCCHLHSSFQLSQARKHVRYGTLYPQVLNDSLNTAIAGLQHHTTGESVDHLQHHGGAVKSCNLRRVQVRTSTESGG